jgi:hypothetical protein
MSIKGQNKEFHQKLSNNFLKSIILPMLMYRLYNADVRSFQGRQIVEK